MEIHHNPMHRLLTLRFVYLSNKSIDRRKWLFRFDLFIANQAILHQDSMLIRLHIIVLLISLDQRLT